mgnify:CR=1 FL=1|jgi:cold-inducible RNA-binding protein
MKKDKVYVGNLPYNTTEDELKDFFGQYGQIKSVNIIVDHHSGRSKGFGFISFASDEEGEAALAANSQDFNGRQLNVNTAKDNPNRGGRGGDRDGGGDSRW